MTNFGKLLRKGQKRHKIKDNIAKWGRCEQCDERSKLYPFQDDKKQVWMLCDQCSDVFADEE